MTAQERFQRRVYVILLGLILIQFAVGGMSVYLLAQNSQRSKENAQTLEQIQAERKRNIRADCESTNLEHGALISFIIASIPKKQAKDARVVAYVERARQAFPQLDCRLVVSRSIAGDG